VRNFVAIGLGGPIRAHLEVALRRVSRLSPRSRCVQPDALHLTLVFLGEMPDALVPHVGEALGRVAAFHPLHTLRVRGSGTFGSLESP
jgi:2'-5' RNA ligase